MVLVAAVLTVRLRAPVPSAVIRVIVDHPLLRIRRPRCPVASHPALRLSLPSRAPCRVVVSPVRIGATQALLVRLRDWRSLLFLLVHLPFLPLTLQLKFLRSLSVLRLRLTPQLEAVSLLHGECDTRPCVVLGGYDDLFICLSTCLLLPA